MVQTNANAASAISEALVVRSQASPVRHERLRQSGGALANNCVQRAWNPPLAHLRQCSEAGRHRGVRRKYIEHIHTAHSTPAAAEASAASAVQLTQPFSLEVNGGGGLGDGGGRFRGGGSGLGGGGGMGDGEGGGRPGDGGGGLGDGGGGPGGGSGRLGDGNGGGLGEGGNGLGGGGLGGAGDGGCGGLGGGAGSGGVGVATTWTGAPSSLALSLACWLPPRLRGWRRSSGVAAHCALQQSATSASSSSEVTTEDNDSLSTSACAARSPPRRSTERRSSGGYPALPFAFCAHISPT